MLKTNVLKLVLVFINFLHPFYKDKYEYKCSLYESKRIADEHYCSDRNFDGSKTSFIFKSDHGKMNFHKEQTDSY